ncbi:MAG: RHS repeat-associated core domain-containing protein [Herminiimonas sp.]|nr:RHS repeat-associated core domain-containing protein [Herminiimonas sp.]
MWRGRTFLIATVSIKPEKLGFDAESGLHSNTHRYFDPVAARYLTPDPLGLAVGPDLYAFALNRPHAVSDPPGLQPAPAQNVGEWSMQDRLKYVV